MSFDARTAKQLAPGEHIIIDECPGLRLEASNSGRSWIYRYKSPLDDRMRQIKIGAWPAMSYGAAVDQWESLRSMRALNKDPALERKKQRAEERQALEVEREEKKKGVYTVRKLVEQYFSGHIEHARKEKGRKEVRWFFDNRLNPIENLPAEKLTRAIAFEFLEGMLQAPVQTKRLKTELAAAWDYALDAGRLPPETPNWWRLVMSRKIKSKGKIVGGVHVGTEKRCLSELEIGELINWLPNFTKLISDVLTMYLWTGTRGLEILQIEVSEISEEADGMWWTIPKAKTKNARFASATDLRVPLIGRAKQVVERRVQLYQSGYIFPGVGENPYVTQKVIGHAVWFHRENCESRPELLRARMKIDNWAPHDLRRSVRTLLASMGCPDEVAEAVLGHMPSGIKGVYNRHSYDKERREWLTKLAARLEQLAA